MEIADSAPQQPQALPILIAQARHHYAPGLSSPEKKAIVASTVSQLSDVEGGSWDSERVRKWFNNKRQQLMANESDPPTYPPDSELPDALTITERLSAVESRVDRAEMILSSQTRPSGSSSTAPTSGSSRTARIISPVAGLAPPPTLVNPFSAPSVPPPLSTAPFSAASASALAPSPGLVPQARPPPVMARDLQAARDSDILIRVVPPGPMLGGVYPTPWYTHCVNNPSP
jgi:hypothetical protein